MYPYYGNLDYKFLNSSPVVCLSLLLQSSVKRIADELAVPAFTIQLVHQGVTLTAMTKLKSLLSFPAPATHRFGNVGML